VSELKKLPIGWLELPLSEVIKTQKGKKPKDLGDKSESRTVPYINIKAFEKKIITEYAPEQKAVKCNDDDILLVWDGARSGLSGRGVSGYVGSTLARVRSDLVNIHFLSYFFGSIYRILNTQTKGVGIPHINPVVLNNLPFYLPPEAEQPRIVEKLDELFSELDAGVAELKAAQIKLTQYSQSLLKSAVEGSLTQNWRETNQEEVGETGEQLLERILIERRQRWEQKKLEEFKAKDKKPPKDWKHKYPEPVQPNTTDLPKIPDGWVWASIAQLSSDEPYSLAIGPFGSNLKVSDYKDSGVPLVFVRNIRSGNYGGEFTKYISEDKAVELSAHKVKAGDVVITKMGEPPGDADVFPLNQPNSIITADCIKVSCWDGLVTPEYLKTVVNSWIGKKQILPITKGVAQKKVSLGRFSPLAIPLPSIFEQRLIMEKVIEKQEVISRQVDVMILGLKQTDAQRKNILKAAFLGQLVSQVPSDEPASVLLKKIKAERKDLAKVTKLTKTKKKPNMKNITRDELAKWVSNYKKNSFTFEQLQKTFQGDYDQLKDCVFEMLSDKDGGITQGFDRETDSIKFIKVNK
jgi:type I restriction enzyme S subunit